MVQQLTRRIGAGGSKLFLSREDVLALPSGGIETGVAAIANSDVIATVGTAIIPGGLVQNPGGIIRLNHSALLLNNTGSTITFTLTIRCNGTTIYAAATSTISASATARHIYLGLELMRVLENTANGIGQLVVGSAGTPTTGTGNIGNAGVVAAFCPTDGFALDWNQQNTIDLRMTLSTANANLTYTPRFTQWCSN